MTYPGGKNGAGVYQAIICQMPPHQVYVEPFLGSGAVLRLKRPAPNGNIGVDLDAAALGAFGEVAGITIIHGDGIRYLQERRWSTGDLVYADPPYLMSSRRIQNRQIYRYELEERQHVELLGTLKALPCMVLVSGYDSPLYREMLDRWRLVTFQAMTRGGKQATEHLWCNFPAPTALHDYRFLGKDYRERERIKRRVERWKARLLAMRAAERLAMIGAIATLEENT